ncbi:MAG: zinc ribbon domain-containing protein [Clostridiales bacterium]|nr:zinc ribbon domain-containing protein [Clostridiales bacterium]
MDFFNKLGDIISDNGKKVAKKAKDVSELTKLNGQLTTEENRKNAAFLAVGKRFFEESVGEVSTEYISDFSVINESLANIEEIKNQIKMIKKIYHCPNCGANMSINASFCSSCGSKVKHPDKPKEDEVNPKEETSDQVEIIQTNIIDEIKEVVEENYIEE